MSSREAPLVRPTARVLLVDGDGRALLFRWSWLDRESGRPFWFGPGGGVEAGETHEAAARRELREETGLVVDERYSFARTERTDVVRDQWTALEPATIAPRRLPSRLPELVAGKLPPAPIDVAV